MYFAREYGCCEFLFVRTKTSKRMINILNKSIESAEDDFNLTNMIIDYKERQREKVLTRMKEVFRELFVINPNKDKKNMIKNNR